MVSTILFDFLYSITAFGRKLSPWVLKHGQEYFRKNITIAYSAVLPYIGRGSCPGIGAMARMLAGRGSAAEFLRPRSAAGSVG